MLDFPPTIVCKVITSPVAPAYVFRFFLDKMLVISHELEDVAQMPPLDVSPCNGATVPVYSNNHLYAEIGCGGMCLIFIVSAFGSSCISGLGSC